MKKIYVIDMVLIVLSLSCLLFFVGYVQPLVIAPLDGYNSINNEVLFEFEHADTLLIDDNAQFESPKKYRVTDGLLIRLEPGVYYWKVNGLTTSETRTLTIETIVDLELRKSGESTYEVANGGNVDVQVDVYDQGSFVERFTLGSQEKTDTKGNFIEGGMK